MRLKSVEILKIPVTVSKKSEILEFLRKAMSQRGRTGTKTGKKTADCVSVVTPNPEQVILAGNVSWFRKLLVQADVAIPDGVGLIIAARILDYQDLTERLSGADLMQELIQYAGNNGVPVGLIGGTGGVALKAFECLKKTDPSLSGFAVDGPRIQCNNSGCQVTSDAIDNSTSEQDKIKSASITAADEVAGLASRILQEKAGLICIGLGAPKQEWLIDQLIRTIRQKRQKQPQTIVFMAVGGAFDMIAGRTPRAPRRIRTSGLEWLWRLTHEPWRWRRQLALPRFVWQVLVERFISY